MSNSANTDKGGKKISSKENKTSLNVWFYVTVTISVIATILGICCMGRKIDTRVKTMVFDRKMMREGIMEGDVVSYDADGMLRKGAGTTIYHGIQEIHNKTLYHLHTAVIGDNIHIAQYDSEMLVTVVDPDTDEILATETFDLPLVQGKAHRVDDILILNENVVLSFGNNQAIPARVTYENNEISVEYGIITNPYKLSTIQPEIMNLNESCVICSYYGKGNRITLVAGCLTENLNMTWGENVEYSDDYIFHDLAGFTGEKFMVVHARVPWFDAKGGKVDVLERQRHPDVYATDSRLHYGLGTVYPNLTVSVGPIMTIEKDSFGFMDMAHLDDSTAVLSFINENNSNGMTSVVFKYIKETDHLMVAGMIDHQRGGGSGNIGGLYSFIRTRAFSPTRFGLYYSDFADCAATALSIVDITPAGDLQLFGPEFIIAPPSLQRDISYYWTNLAPSGHERFFVMESLTVRKGKEEPHASIHVGEIYNAPLGVVSEVTSTGATVVVDGVMEIKNKKLVPGKEYMGNSNGQIVEGDYVGEMNRDSYPFYTNQLGKTQVLTTKNQIGFAISEQELFVRVPDYIELFYVCYSLQEYV